MQTHSKTAITEYPSISVLLIFLICLTFFCGTKISVMGQQEIKPITRQNLISALKKGRRERLSSEPFIRSIKEYGVAFLMTPEEEDEIRRAASFLGNQGVDELIKTLYDNYRPSNGDVYADMTLYEENAQFPKSQYPDAMITLPVETTLKYSYTRVKGTVVVDYEMPYLSLLAKGGPIKPFYDDTGTPRFFWQFPRLALKVVNNSSKRVVFTEAAITVKNSQVVKDAVLTINPGSLRFRDGRFITTGLGSFSFINYGWGDVLDAAVNLTISSSKDFPDLDGKRQTVQLGTFSELGTIDILEGLPKPSPQCDWENGRIPAEFVTVHGRIDYSTESHEHRAVDFETPVRVRFCSGLHGASHEISQYDVQLEAGKSEYTKYVSLTQDVRPGETDYFIIRLGSDKTAKYELTFSFRTPGFFIPEKTVRVAVFVPRSTGFLTEPARERIKINH